MEVTIAAGAWISLPRYIPSIMAPTLQHRRIGQDLDLLGQRLGQHDLCRLALPGLLVGEVSRHDCLLHPVVNRVLVELSFLGEGSQGDCRIAVGGLPSSTSG